MSTAAIRSALALTTLAVLVYLLFLVVQPFLIPLGWAAVLAIVFNPLHDRLEQRWGAGRAAAATTLAATVLVIAPIVLVMTAFFHEALDAATALQDALTDGRFGWLEPAWRSLQERIPAAQRVDLAGAVTDAARTVAPLLASQSGAALRNVGGFVFDLIVALFASFFVLRDSSAIMRAVRQLMPLDEAVRERLIAQTRALVSVSVTSAGIIAAVQGALGGIVFALIGIDAPVFWGVVMGFFCLVPLGAWIVWAPAAALLALNGSITRAIILAALGIGVVSAVDNVLRPALLSEGTKMNGLVILIALLGGVRVFGALGLVLGPILLAAVVALLTTYLTADKITSTS